MEGDKLLYAAEGGIDVTVTPINGGEISLPERSFVAPSNFNTSITVPSLSFLITHPGLEGHGQVQPRHILFDLGLRARLEDYTKENQSHLQSRIPYQLGPGVAETLRQGGLNPAQIETVILSHVHYDHHGDPADYPNAQFLLGSGSLSLINHGLGASASHQFFDPDLFRDIARVEELPDPQNSGLWKQLGPFERTFDLLGDASIFVVDAPGHLPGHINLLCRIGPCKWAYLGGDSCHDVRLLSGECAVATWQDKGRETCIHLNKVLAEDTISRIRRLQDLEGLEVEIIMAHDVQWWKKNKGRSLQVPA